MIYKKIDSTKWKSEFRISKSDFPSCNLVIATLWQSVWWQNHFISSFFSLLSILSIDISLAGALSVRLHEGLRRLVPLRPLQGDQVPGDNLYLVSQKPTELTSLAPVWRTLSIAADEVATNIHLLIHQLDFLQSFCKSEITGLSDL